MTKSLEVGKVIGLIKSKAKDVINSIHLSTVGNFNLRLAVDDDFLIGTETMHPRSPLEAFTSHS